MNFDKVSHFLDGLEESIGIPATDCIVTYNHDIVYRHMTGFSDFDKKKPITGNELYRVYSASKVITMVAVMQLIECGRIDLYDEVRKYLPEFGLMEVAEDYEVGVNAPWPTKASPRHYAHKQIRIIDLMAMTSGLSYDLLSEELQDLRKETDNKATTREVVRTIASMPLLFEPDTRFSYGLGHDVLAAVVEVVSGLKFSDYLRANVFVPLGVDDFYYKATPEIKDRIVCMYTGDYVTRDLKPVTDNSPYDFWVTENYESGGAGLITSVETYSAVIDALANGGIGRNGARILKEETVRMFCKPYTYGIEQEDFYKLGKGAYAYGLGVRVRIPSETDSSKSPVGEFGWDGAADAYVLVDPINHLSIFYAQHTVNFPLVYGEVHPVLRDLVYDSING